MPDESELSFLQGPEATQVVDHDPFWSTVHRRHPDVDIVVLPGAGEPTHLRALPSEEPLVDPATVVQTLRAHVEQFWSRLGLPQPTDTRESWFAGPLDGTVRWEGTLSLADAREAAGSDALLRANQQIDSTPGWSALVPPTGIPRVLASRAAHLDREELLVFLGPDERFVVRMRSDLLHVGGDVAAALVAGGSA